MFASVNAFDFNGKTIAILTILKKNILQRYRPYVVLTPFQTVDEMKYALKILEATMAPTDGNRNVRFGSRDRNRSFSSDRSKEIVHSNSNNNRSRYDRFQTADNKKAKIFETVQIRTVVITRSAIIAQHMVIVHQLLCM